MANGYWVIRTYTAGAVGEKIKYWVPGEKPTKSERKIKSDIKQVQRNEANAEKALARLIHANFTPRDYLLQFSYTEEALEKLSENPDVRVTLLDIMLPDGSGLDILRDMSARGRKCNVIILSAKDSIEDKVTGLDLGADDYLAKPFHLAELHARLKSVIRRSRNDGDSVMRVANVCVHTDSFRVEVDGKPLELGRKEYDILKYFMNRPARARQARAAVRL